MAEMAVWAPGKDSVDLVAGDRRTPMTAAGGGWWTCPAEAAGPAGDYAYSINKGPPRPDPRSAYQPQGVDGPSRIVDHGAFGWTDGGCGDLCKYNPDKAKEALAKSGFKGTVEITSNADGGHKEWIEAACGNIKNTLGLDCVFVPVQAFGENPRIPALAHRWRG